MSEETAEAIATEVQDRGWTVAVAESLTGGLLSSRLARAPKASEWLRGGLVAYGVEAKQELLGVSPGPVIIERAALEMAVGAIRLFRADVALATTGVGGPDPEEGQPPGTVWVGVCVSGEPRAHRLQLGGDPPEVCERACDEALALLLARLHQTGRE